MADPYKRIVFESQLYHSEIIEKIAKMNHKWSRMSNKEKEKLCYHIMICVYLSNKEETNELMTRRKRKVGDEYENFKENLFKRPSTSKDHQENPLSTSTPTPTSGDQTMSSSTTDDTVETEEGEDLSGKYRFELLNHTIGKERTVREICLEWGVPVPSGQWDLIDHQEKKLVLVIVEKEENKAIGYFNYMKLEIPNNSSAYFLPINSRRGIWIDEPGKAVKGEDKILQFCVMRQQIFEELGVSMESVCNKENIEDSLFCSDFINKCVKEWKKELLRDEGAKITKEEMYQNLKAPATITPEVLKEGLKDTRKINPNLKETDWKGKILPEGYVHNLVTYNDKDLDMVDEVFEHIKAELGTLEQVVLPLNENSVLTERILNQIIESWENSWKNTFDFLAKSDAHEVDELIKALGIKMKGKVYSELDTGEAQQEFKELMEENYPLWYEDVITELSMDSPYGDLTPNCELLVTPPNDDHPLARMIEPLCTEIIADMMSTQAGIMTSKLTNLYSRLSGAYSGENMNSNKPNKGIAIMPIVANLSADPESVLFEKSHNLRLLSGVVIRSKPHARKATDRIGFISIEIMDNTCRNRYFLKYLLKGVHYICKNQIISVRQNSIMKEDGCYNTYTANALFTPINMLGCMTLENPDVRHRIDMESEIRKIYGLGKKWFLDRYVEGLMFSIIGNSRDEGYFACLRKLFMAMMAFRRDKTFANYDISNFCKKTNECLIDNPISKHFHNTLLDILDLYTN